MALLRLSGDDVGDVVARVTRPVGDAPVPWGRPRRVVVVDAEGAFDDGVLWLQAAPRTATGEPMAELGLHGNPLLVERALAALVAAGARPAWPGEFTRRALVAGKLDLLEAEGVDQVVRATSPAGLAVARMALRGGLSDAMGSLRERLIGVVAELEARLDYPDEDLTQVDDEALVAEVDGVASSASALAGTHVAGRRAVDGVRVALVGAVNAGKSSLFNALVGQQRAIVSPIPGTTRDVVEATAILDGLAVTLLDTAGERVTDDPIEAAGQALAEELVAVADHVVVVLRARPDGPDATERALLARTADRPRTVVVNGVDEGGVVPEGALPLVAVRREGVDRLVVALRAALIGEVGSGGVAVVGSARAAACLRELHAQLQGFGATLRFAGPAVAADQVTRGLEVVDALTGSDTREDVLDALFARFCIGK